MRKSKSLSSWISTVLVVSSMCGLFERITPSGVKPTLLYASGGAPLVVNQDGNLYYGSGFPGGDEMAPGGFTVTRMSTDGKKTLFAPDLKTTREKLDEAVTGLAAGLDVTAAFTGSKAGNEREVAGIKLCWCPPGKFTMGSPPGELERRPDETQVEVTLTKGFWMGKYEVTQGQWKWVDGEFPGRQPTGEGDDFPVVEVNYAEAEGFCRKLTEKAHAAGDLPKEWEFRLPTEAQWEYACRAGTTTATSFGDRLSSKQANFHGKPYNGAEDGPSPNHAAKVGMEMVS